MVAGPWWGKAAGTLLGAVLGSWPGALLGLVLGYIFDERLRLEPYSGRTWRGCQLSRSEQEFLTAAFSVMGHLAKADGRVSEKEVAATEQVMARLGLDDNRRQRAIYLFTRGKARNFPLRAVLRRFRGGAGRQPETLDRFLRCLLEVAYADGEPSPKQQRLLSVVAKRLRVSEQRLQELARTRGTCRGDSRPRAVVPASPLADAFRELGIAENASNEQVTLAYRRAISRHHPDRLAAANASEEALKEAHIRTQRIREAYEQIRRARGF